MTRMLVVWAAVVAVMVPAWYLLKPGPEPSPVPAPTSAPGERATGTTSAPALPTPAELQSMPEAQRNALQTRLMTEAAAQATVVLDEVMDMTAQPVLSAAGDFSGADAAHTGSGRAAVYKLPDASYVVRLEDFRVTNGPALVVALVVHPNPRTPADVRKGYISIGDLKANAGNHNYPVPAQFDVLSFGSVVIWCELFGVIFATAPLALY